jgi:hypothetical protein
MLTLGTIALCGDPGVTQLTAATDKVYQLPAHGRWFSAGSPVSSTTKTGRHDIAEMLLRSDMHTSGLLFQFASTITVQPSVLVHIHSNSGPYFFLICSLPRLWYGSLTKTGRHDIAEMLLKVALSTINQ